MLAETWNSPCQGWWPTAVAMAVAVTHVAAPGPRHGDPWQMVIRASHFLSVWKPMGGEREPESLPQQWHSVNMVTPPYSHPSSRHGIHRIWGGKGRVPCFGTTKWLFFYPVFRTVFFFFFSLWNSGTFLIQIDFYTRGYLNMVLNIEHHLSRNNDANCHLLSIYYMPGSSVGAL